MKSDSIALDGTINELEWENSVIAENFVEINPGNNSPAKTRTKVQVSYDTKNLYVAFHSFDNPELIRANQSKRDDIEDDDLFWLKQTNGNNPSYRKMNDTQGYNIQTGIVENFDRMRVVYQRS